MTSAVIEVKNVIKHFAIDRPLNKQLLNPLGSGKKICAVDNVSFSVEPGEIVGLVGPNGAGKTTLLRILADLLKPDSGEINLCGHTLGVNSRHVRSKIGYVSSDERSFFWRLTGRENLKFFGRLYELSHRQVKMRTSELIQQFYFEEKADRLFKDYSAGMRKKVSVMRALLHKPIVLLLDEVTNSLDPASAKMVKALVREYVSKDNCCAAVWSTHRLEEIAQICDQVVTIESGRIRRQGLTRDFKIDHGNSSDYLLRNGDQEKLLNI